MKHKKQAEGRLGKPQGVWEPPATTPRTRGLLAQRASGVDLYRTSYPPRKQGTPKKGKTQSPDSHHWAPRSPTSRDNTSRHGRGAPRAVRQKSSPLSTCRTSAIALRTDPSHPHRYAGTQRWHIHPDSARNNQRIKGL
ncbi:Hypothetical predicted protein [Pelobates cultripes]|uniref:Uncharacterized protein n=1 Tax=Pelobates cultripes TaxID=61616 RepID=A0AAD1WIB2_PELCU|nr:Hypothetical predicted protein [Pelobates cultripes]